MVYGLTVIGTAVEQKTGEDSTVTDFLQDVGKRKFERQQSILQSLGTPTETIDLFKIKSFGMIRKLAARNCYWFFRVFRLGLGAAS